MVSTNALSNSKCSQITFAFIFLIRKLIEIKKNPLRKKDGYEKNYINIDQL